MIEKRRKEARVQRIEERVKELCNTAIEEKVTEIEQLPEANDRKEKRKHRMTTYAKAKSGNSHVE